MNEIFGPRMMRSLEAPAEQGSAPQSVQEVTQVIQVVVSRLKDVDGLDAIIDKDAQQEGRRPITSSRFLILDNGHLRPVNDTDRSLAPNHFLVLEYQRDLVHQISTIIASGSGLRVFSYMLPR